MSLDETQTALKEYEAAVNHSFTYSERLFSTIERNLRSQASDLTLQAGDVHLSHDSQVDESGYLNGIVKIFGKEVQVASQYKGNTTYIVLVDGSNIGIVDGNSTDSISMLMNAIFKRVTDYFDALRERLVE